MKEKKLKEVLRLNLMQSQKAFNHNIGMIYVYIMGIYHSSKDRLQLMI